MPRQLSPEEFRKVIAEAKAALDPNEPMTPEAERAYIERALTAAESRPAGTGSWAPEHGPGGSRAAPTKATGTPARAPGSDFINEPSYPPGWVGNVMRDLDKLPGNILSGGENILDMIASMEEAKHQGDFRQQNEIAGDFFGPLAKHYVGYLNPMETGRRIYNQPVSTALDLFPGRKAITGAVRHPIQAAKGAAGAMAGELPGVKAMRSIPQPYMPNVSGIDESLITRFDDPMSGVPYGPTPEPIPPGANVGGKPTGKKAPTPQDEMAALVQKSADQAAAEARPTTASAAPEPTITPSGRESQPIIHPETGEVTGATSAYSSGSPARDQTFGRPVPDVPPATTGNLAVSSEQLRPQPQSSAEALKGLPEPPPKPPEPISPNAGGTLTPGPTARPSLEETLAGDLAAEAQAAPAAPAPAPLPPRIPSAPTAASAGPRLGAWSPDTPPPEPPTATPPPAAAPTGPVFGAQTADEATVAAIRAELDRIAAEQAKNPSALPPDWERHLGQAEPGAPPPDVPEPPAPSPVPDTPPPSPSSPPSPAAASVEDQIVSQLESQGGSPDAPAPVTFKIARGKDFAMEGTYQLAFSDGRQYPIYKNTSPGSLGEWRVDGLNNGISGFTRAELIDKLKTLDESRPYIDAYTGNPDPRTGGAGTIGDRLRSYRQTHGLSEPSAGVSTVMGEELLPGRGPKPGPRAAPAPAAETATPELPDAWKDLTTDPKGGTDISFMGTGIAKNVLARLVTRFGADQLKALGWLQPVTPTTPTKPFSGISGAQGPGFIRRAPGNIGRGMGGAFIARDKETEDDALAAELLEELTRQRAAGTL